MFPIRLDFQPVIQTLETDAPKDIEEIEREILKDVTAKAPMQMQSLMVKGGVSKKGQPPRVQSGTLKGSIEGNEQAFEISMAGHAFYLDPIFEGGTSGGYLHRPFVERAIAKALDEII